MIRPALLKHRRAAAFSLVELLVVLAVIAVLTLFLIPAVTTVRARAQSTQCLSNLHHIHAGVLMYAAGHEGWLPPNNTNSNSGAWWQHVYPSLIADAGVFECPLDETGWINEANAALENNGKLSYGAMGNDDPYAKQGVMDKNLGMFINPSQCVMILDAPRSGRQLAKNWYYNWPKYITDIKPVHGDKVNMVFVDGHVDALSVDEIQQRFDEGKIKISYGNMTSRTAKLER
ncbi:prepilin-type N-terminal cleavage/methylation domain-containing protein [Ruficoccus sp. ZRK36]|uniref:prepilin-type N-terminal cleavage/methylation domain-containing protein n=1 Tax=Ruficoccus sp. ZRK36 TaxID=2866311 RepID=UPI001C72DDB1|nr:prepilin-type N-terminal cleavage/methylation domain-containing protein [Ruficoccus sp. ZRK36]QYY37510.1 prepilin-type N-terminal cleavage/methylation domain-containing protein [Ruficoccus sp. ZRK36]